MYSRNAISALAVAEECHPDVGAPTARGVCVRGRCPREARQSCERLTARAPSPLRSGRRRRERTEPTRGEGSPRGKPGPSPVTCSSKAWSRSTATSSTSPPGCRGPGRSGTSARRKASCSSSARASVIRSATIRASRRSPPPPSRSPSAAPPGPAAPERFSSSSVLGRKRASKLMAGVGDEPALALPATRSARASRGLTPVPAHTLASRSRRQV